jgi:HisJ family histidinol phosphate phosphatase
VKSDFPHISSRLEIEYFPTILSQIEAFIDDYGNQFDFLIGSIHHLTESVGITIKPEFQLFLEKNKSLGSILSQYFNLEMEMVRLDIFDAIAHPDVIFRHCPTEVITPSDVQSAIHSLQDLAQLCIRKKIFFEINLSTFNSSYNSISPSKELVSQFVSIDTPLFIGSDSHSLQNFQERVVNIRKFNNIVRNEWLFEKKL